MTTQRNSILAYLQEHGSITPLDALHLFDCMRLGARISELRDLGEDIETILEERTTIRGTKKRYARYVYKFNPDLYHSDLEILDITGIKK